MCGGKKNEKWERHLQPRAFFLMEHKYSVFPLLKLILSALRR